MIDGIPNGTALANHAVPSPPESPGSSGEAGRVHNGRFAGSQVNGAADHLLINPEGSSGEGEAEGDSGEGQRGGGWSEGVGLRMELTEEERERQRERDRASSLIGQKLLQGWAMLGLHCETCLQPIMRNREREMYCVVCDVRVVSEEEAASMNLQQSAPMATSTIQITAVPAASDNLPSTQGTGVDVLDSAPPSASSPALDLPSNAEELTEIFTDDDTPMFTSGHVVHTTVNGADVIALTTDQACFPKPEAATEDNSMSLPTLSNEEPQGNQGLPDPSSSKSWSSLGIVATEPLRDVDLSLGGGSATSAVLPPLQPLSGTVAPFQHPFGGTEGGTALPFPGGQREVAPLGDVRGAGFGLSTPHVSLGEWSSQVEPGRVTSVAAVADACLLTLAHKLEAARRNAEASNSAHDLRRILPLMEECARTMLAIQSLASSAAR